MSLEPLLDAIPLVMMIGIGVLLRVTGLVDEDSRLVLTRIGYYVTIPTAIATSIARAELTREMALLPLVGFVLPVVLVGVVYLATRHLAAQPEVRGVMLISMVGLVVFGYPFAQVFYGDGALAQVAMYDVGNVVFISTVALWLAQRYGKNGLSGPSGVAPGGSLPAQAGKALLAMFKSPFIWAALLGLVLAVFRVPLTGPLGGLLDRLAAANTPVVMMSVGTFLRPRAAQRGLLTRVVLIRMVLGGVLAWLIGLALGLRGLEMVIVTMAASLPVGTTPLVYAGNEGLDAELAASVISVTVVVGAVLVNVVPHLMAAIYL